MLRRYAKLTISMVLIGLCSLSTNSFAGNVYGKVGYSDFPFKVVVGYSDHGKQHRHKHYKHTKHYYVPQHYRHHQYKHHHNYKGHYYKPRRYCRSRY